MKNFFSYPQTDPKRTFSQWRKKFFDVEHEENSIRIQECFPFAYFFYSENPVTDDDIKKFFEAMAVLKVLYVDLKSGTFVFSRSLVFQTPQDYSVKYSNLPPRFNFVLSRIWIFFL